MVNEVHIQSNAVIVDALVEMVIFPFTFQDGERHHSLLNIHFCLHVTLVIRFEGFPLIKCVRRQVSRSEMVCRSRFTRLAEISNQFLANGQLLLFNAENFADLFKR